MKLLEVTLDSGMSWKNHIEELGKRLSSAIFAIRRLKIVSPRHSRSRIFCYSLKYSLIWYSSVRLVVSNAKNTFLLQKRGVWALCTNRQLKNWKNTFPVYALYNDLSQLFSIEKGKYAENSNSHTYHQIRMVSALQNKGVPREG